MKKEHWRLIKPYFSFKPPRPQKKLWIFLIGLTPLMAGASTVIPTAIDVNHLYYQIGGGSDYGLPAAPYTLRRLIYLLKRI